MGEGALERARIYVEAEMTEPEIHPCAAGQAAIVCTRSPLEGSVNQDAAALVRLGTGQAVLAVADGVGGGRAGATASGTAVRELASTLLGAEPEGELRGPILDGIERANRAVLELGLGAATTLAVVEVSGTALRPYHVGDSTILVVGQRGKIKHQTIPHSPVGYAVEAGLLDRQAALHHEDRHLISNAVGTPDMRIEIGPALRLAPRDSLLLASDGLFDNLHESEIIELVRRGRLPEVAQLLLVASQQRMADPQEGHPSKPDDLSFIVFRRTPTKRTRRAAREESGGG